MKLSLSLLLSSLLFTSFAQTQEQKDSLINEMCKTLTATKGNDSVRIYTAYDQHLAAFVQRYPDEHWEELGNAIYFRFQRNCPEFKKALDRMNPPKDDWQVVDAKPATKMNKKECQRFFSYESFFYLEKSGDTVALSIKGGYWIDHPKNGTYSKLKLHADGGCEFEIEFVESNNIMRKNFSAPGDRYQYQIIEQTPAYFNMSVRVPGTDHYSLFRLFYQE